MFLKIEIDKLWYTHMVEYHRAMKSDLQIQTTAWMESQRYNFEGKKPDMKEYILQDSFSKGGQTRQN